MALHKGMNEHEFIQNYTRIRQDRKGLALADKPNGECIFLEGNDCAVQAAKPRQCRAFPNLWNFPGFDKVCHAVPHAVSEEEFKRLTGDMSPGARVSPRADTFDKTKAS
jgi:Fe-S-cluster containining protein